MVLVDSLCYTLGLFYLSQKKYFTNQQRRFYETAYAAFLGATVRGGPGETLGTPKVGKDGGPVD